MAGTFYVPETDARRTRLGTFFVPSGRFRRREGETEHTVATYNVVGRDAILQCETDRLDNPKEKEYKMTDKNDEKKPGDKVELSLDNLDGVAGGKSSPQYRPFQGFGNKDVYDRMMQLENHTFRR